MRSDLDLRVVRSFVAVAEELHFTRAASRLYVAQQALSRDVARLEALLGTRLFERSSRRVVLTADGERFLDHARALLAVHDAALEDMAGVARPLVVDVVGEGLTAGRVVAAARAGAPHLELAVRYSGGLGAALGQLLAGRVDVAFGRPEGLGHRFPPELDRRLVRLEPLALLVLEDDPLAALDAVPLGRLRGVEVDASSGNADAPEWVDLAVELLGTAGARPSPPHVHVVGPGETGRHLRAHGLPILTMSECPPVPGAVVRPLVDPVPLYPWALVHRRDTRHVGLVALAAAATRLGAREGWTVRPSGSWLPDADRSWVT